MYVAYIGFYQRSDRYIWDTFLVRKSHIYYPGPESWRYLASNESTWLVPTNNFEVE
jgi:hypothetical protein